MKKQSPAFFGVAVAVFLTATLPSWAWAARFVGSCGTPSYLTIQRAVNAASSGETIYLCDGQYNESVQVNKSLTFRSKSGDKSKVIWNSSSGSNISDTGGWRAQNQIIVQEITFKNSNPDHPVFDYDNFEARHEFSSIEIETPRRAIRSLRGLSRMENVTITITGSPSTGCSQQENTNGHDVEAAIVFSANFDATLRNVRIQNQPGKGACEGVHVYKTEERKSVLFDDVVLDATKGKGIHIVDAGQITMKNVRASSTDAEAIRLEANVGKDTGNNYSSAPVFENITATGYNAALYSFNGAASAKNLDLTATKSADCRNNNTDADFALVLGNRWATTIELAGESSNRIRSSCGGIKILQTNANPRQNVTIDRVVIDSAKDGIWFDDAGKVTLRNLTIHNQTGNGIYFSARVGSGSDGKPENAPNGNGPELNDIAITSGGNGIFSETGIGKVEKTTIHLTSSQSSDSLSCSQTTSGPVGIYFKPYFYAEVNETSVSSDTALPLLICQQPNRTEVKLHRSSMTTQRAQHAALIELSTDSSYILDGFCATGATDSGLKIAQKAKTVTVVQSSFSGDQYGLNLDAFNPTQVRFERSAFFGQTPINTLSYGRNYVLKNNFYEGHDSSSPYQNGQYQDSSPAQNPPLLMNCPTGCSRITMFTSAPALSSTAVAVTPHYQRSADALLNLPADSYDLWGLPFVSDGASIRRTPDWRTEATTSRTDRSGKLKGGDSSPLSQISDDRILDPISTANQPIVRSAGPKGSYFGRFSHPTMQPIILGEGQNRFALVPNDDGMLYTVRVDTGAVISAWMPQTWLDRLSSAPPDGLWQEDGHAMTGGVAAIPWGSGYLVAGTGAQGRLHYALLVNGDGTIAQVLADRYTPKMATPTYAAPRLLTLNGKALALFLEGDETRGTGNLITWQWDGKALTEAITPLSSTPTSDLFLFTDDAALGRCDGMPTLFFAGKGGSNHQLYKVTVDAAGNPTVTKLFALPAPVNTNHAPVRYWTTGVSANSGKRYVALVASDALTQARAATNREDFLLVYEINGNSACDASNWQPRFFASMSDAGRWVNSTYQSRPCSDTGCASGSKDTVQKIGGRITGQPAIWQDTLFLPVSVGFAEAQCSASAYLYPYRLDEATKIGAISDKEFTVSYHDAGGEQTKNYKEENILLGSSGAAYSPQVIDPGGSGQQKLVGASGSGPAVISVGVKPSGKRLMWREIIFE